jgi:hypothetical protein
VNLLGRLVALERLRRPSQSDQGPIMLHVTADYRGDHRSPRFRVPGRDEPLKRASYERWADAQWDAAQAAGRTLGFRIYITELTDRPPIAEPEDRADR